MRRRTAANICVRNLMTSSTSRLVTAILLFSCVLAWSRTFAAAGQPPADSNRDGQLTEKLDSLVQQHAGQVGMAVKHLTSGYHFEYRATEPMPTASLIKFPLLIAAYQAIEAGEIGLQDPITLHESDKVPGSGILTAHFSEGVTLPLGDVMRLMMVYSDNTATNLVIDHVGLAATSQLMEQLGCPETKLHSQTYRRDTSLFPDRSQRFGLGSTTAAEMVKLLELLQQGRLVSPAASESIRQTMLACDDDTKLARYLPAGVKVANKSGAVSALRTRCGPDRNALGTDRHLRAHHTERRPRMGPRERRRGLVRRDRPRGLSTLPRRPASRRQRLAKTDHGIRRRAGRGASSGP